METPSIEFIVYAAFFRLAMISAGVACVFMGYRLFVLGVMPREGAEIDARSGEIRLSLKNAAPGTCFALFGAAILATTTVWAIPEIRLAQISDAEGVRSSFELRNRSSRHEQLSWQGQTLVEAGDLEGAISAFAEALSDQSISLESASEPLKGLALVYHQQNRLGEAIAYANLVIQSSPDDAETLALIGRIERDRGNLQRAIRAMKLAADLNPALMTDLEELEKLGP